MREQSAVKIINALQILIEVEKMFEKMFGLGCEGEAGRKVDQVKNELLMTLLNEFGIDKEDDDKVGDIVLLLYEAESERVFEKLKTYSTTP